VEEINTNFASALDKLRAASGTDELRSYFSGLLKSDRNKALELANDRQLGFGTLFALRDQLARQDVFKELNAKYQKALKLTNDLMGDKARRLSLKFRQDDDYTASVLRWMLDTGGLEDGLGREYDRLMDFLAGLLVKRFRDYSVLIRIAEMIFSRHKKGKLIHDLVWAFFESKNTDSILIIARWLSSNDVKDRKLALKLLGFIPSLNPPAKPDPYGYTRVLYWLQENKPFIYYTGESLHQSCSPLHFRVSMVAKYLCRSVSVETGEPLYPLNEFEKSLAENFKKLPYDSQQKLSDFSYLLYRRNIFQWHTFMRLDLGRQLALASGFSGGLP